METGDCPQPSARTENIVHYRDFNRAFVKPPEGERARYDYVYLRSRRTEDALVINLESYFDHVRSFACDDVFVVRYLLRRIVTLLSLVVLQPDRDFDQHVLAEVVDRMYDSFALLGKLVRHHTLVVPPHQVINGYPAVHVYSHIRPGPVVERVPYGQIFSGYGTAYGSTWYRSIGRAEKYCIDRSKVYMVDVLRLATGASNAESVFFKLTDLLGMFKDIVATDWNAVSVSGVITT